MDVRDALRRTPLMISMQHRHIVGARLLLAARADVSAQDAAGHTSLSIAARSGHAKGVLLLMRRGGSSTLEMADRDGMRPLHWAASLGDSLGVKLLLRLKSSSTPRTHSGLSAIDLASNAAHWHVVACLESLKPNSQSGPAHWASGDMTPATDPVDPVGCYQKKYHKKRSPLDMQRLAHAALHEIMHPRYVTRKVIPVFCHVACMIAVYEHFRFSRAGRWKLTPRSAVIFEFLVPVILCGVQYMVRVDPGVVQENSGIERLMSMLDSDIPTAELPQMDRLCTTTWVLKGPRTKYCAITGACIEDFDHYCILLDAPIGRGNHRFFILLMVAEVIAQMAHAILCLTTLFSDEVGQGPFWQVLLLWRHPALAFLLTVHCVTLPGITCLIIVQLVLVSQNLTVNELVNMRRYQHFWTGTQSTFFNPFNKGSILKNCLDFWWNFRLPSSYLEMHV